MAVPGGLEPPTNGLGNRAPQSTRPRSVRRGGPKSVSRLVASAKSPATSSRNDPALLLRSKAPLRPPSHRPSTSTPGPPGVSFFVRLRGRQSMLFPLWLENIVLAAQQWLPAFLLSGFALFL